jgi:hypothetical protein
MAVVLATVLLPITMIFGAMEAGAATATISSTGPLTSVGISDQLNCSVNHTGDAAGEFYNDTACGTFLVVDGTMYFSPAVIPAGRHRRRLRAVPQRGGNHAEWPPVSLAERIS